MSQKEDNTQAEENAPYEAIPLTQLIETRGEGKDQRTELTSDKPPINQIDLGLMQSIARCWLGKNSNPWNTLRFATGLNTAMSLFDTFSDIFVAIQLIQNGDLMWGITVLLIDYLPMWQVLLHAITSDAWKDLEDSKERWITVLILIFAPVAFPLLQLYWLIKMKTAKKVTFNFLHQNAKVAELVCGTVESPLQFLFLMICYAYNKLPLPWKEEKVFIDSVGNRFNFGAVPGILSMFFSCLTMIKSIVDISESKTKQDAISYGAYSFTTCVFRLTGYLLIIIVLRELSTVMFGMIAIGTFTAIIRFDEAAWRGMSWCTTFIVGLFIPCAVSKDPHKTQYKDETTTTTLEVAKTRRHLTSAIAICAIPIILLFNGIVLWLLYLPWYHVSSDLLMDESDSKRNIKSLIIFLVLPTGICSLIGALCIKQEKSRTVSTVGLVLMAVLTIAGLAGSFIHVFKVNRCKPDPCSNIEVCRNDVFTHRCEKDNLVSFGGSDGSKKLGDVESSTIYSSNPDCFIPDLPTSIKCHSTIKTSIGIISCGGIDDNGYTNRCHLLKGNGRWVDFPRMKERQADFDMFEVNMTLYAIGGYGDENSFESIDLKESKEWTKRDLTFGIRRHCITRYNETHFLLTGGYLNGKVTAETKWFNAESMEWSNGPTMRKARINHGCVKISKTSNQKGQALVIGGLFSDRTIESLEIGKDEWKVVGTTDPEKNLRYHSVTESHSPNYIAYSIGGYSGSGEVVKEIYGIKDDFSFTKVGELIQPRYNHASLNLLRQEIPYCS